MNGRLTKRRTVLVAGAAVLAVLVATGVTVWRMSGDDAGVQIGGPFTLIDQDGKTRHAADFRGEYMLVYFGYSFCPDVCPTELNDISIALDSLGPAASRIQPIFISVDPERDTPDLLKRYVGYFYPRLIGLTGSDEQIRDAARAYHVYYAKSKQKTADGAYLMDHTSIIYLMGPEGRYVTHFSYGTTPEEIARRLKQYVG